MRLATWNMKQAVAPRKPLLELWGWLDEEVDPDVAVLTEARVPKDGPPVGWCAEWVEGGFGPKRSWGTVIAGRGVELERVHEVRIGRKAVPLAPRWPAGAVVTDAIVRGERWATIVGFYGITTDLEGKSCKHGRYSTRALFDDLRPLFESDRGERIIVAGDLNLWPRDLPSRITNLGLVDLIEYTANDRPPLPGCSGCELGDDCGHMWTHKNGNSPNAAVQQIDYIFATEALCHELGEVYGGIADFPDAWGVSDHAPVVAEFTSPRARPGSARY